MEIVPWFVPTPIPPASSPANYLQTAARPNRSREAIALLGPSCDRFTEGFEATALKVVKYSWHRGGRLLTTRSPSAEAG